MLSIYITYSWIRRRARPPNTSAQEGARTTGPQTGNRKRGSHQKHIPLSDLSFKRNACTTGCEKVTEQ